MLKSGLYHFILGDVYLDRVVYPYCKGTWLYSQNIEPEGHEVWRMRSYSLNIKTKGHLILPKIAWLPSYLMLRSGQYHFILRDVCLDRVVFPCCKGTWLYSQNIKPEGHAVCMHVA